ncbi:hypothetical protein F5887DRAFT_1080936 [Amanita rubescens]|nr:hypothetical protein F5887DRAFT_1080936 [Amanita rubescens]
MPGRHVDFASTNICITHVDETLEETKSANDDDREQYQGALCVLDPPSPVELRDTPSPSPIEPQVYARISCGSESLVRYPLAKRPIDTGLFHSQELIRPAVNPGRDNIIVKYPPMDMWEVMASNDIYITVGDVLMKLYENRSSFPPGSLFNGLLLTDDEALLLKI